MAFLAACLEGAFREYHLLVSFVPEWHKPLIAAHHLDYGDQEPVVPTVPQARAPISPFVVRPQFFEGPPTAFVTSAARTARNLLVIDPSSYAPAA